MTHHTDAERALASLRHLYQQMASGMVKDSAQAKRIAEGLLSPAIAKLEQAALRAPAAPVLQGYKITEEQHVAAVKVLHRAAGVDGLPQRMLDAMLAAAPQPPEAQAPVSNGTLAAPVELPEHTTSEHSKPMCGAAPKVDPIAWYVTGCSTMLDEHDAKAEAKRCGGCAQAVPLYTEQQVRDLLATHGIGASS